MTRLEKLKNEYARVDARRKKLNIKHDILFEKMEPIDKRLGELTFEIQKEKDKGAIGKCFLWKPDKDTHVDNFGRSSGVSHIYRKVTRANRDGTVTVVELRLYPWKSMRIDRSGMTNVSRFGEEISVEEFDNEWEKAQRRLWK